MDVVINRHRDDARLGANVARLLGLEGFVDAQRTIKSWSDYRPTPLVNLPDNARRLGLADVRLKDESERLGVGSFKALGGGYAVHKHAAERIRAGSSNASSLTVATATDGNHGRAVAWGAHRVGCKCVVYLHSQVSESRETAIAEYGARVLRIEGNYDDAVHYAASDARANGYLLVSDTATAGDSGCALDVMQGYRLLLQEVIEQGRGWWPTHVFAQAGCGGLAASMLRHLVSVGTQPRPTFVVVEPQRAACLYESAQAGRPRVIRGSLATVMAGLAVGEVSYPAWEILGPGADAFLVISDDVAVEGMRVLARGCETDMPVVAGESGAAGFAALRAAAQDPHARQALGLAESSRVLVINTEGDTDPTIYRDLVGLSSTEVRARR